MVTDALEDRLRLRLRLLLTWQIRAAELSRHPETCPPEEYPPYLAPDQRAEWLQTQEDSARAAVNRFRETLKQRAVRFNDLSRTYAYRRKRLPEKAAEGQLIPTQANQEAQRLLHLIESYTRYAALCTSLAETDSTEGIGGPVKMRLYRYEAELERFSSLNALLDTLEQSGRQAETPPAAEKNPAEADRPPAQKQGEPRPRWSLPTFRFGWTQQPGRRLPHRWPAENKRLQLTQGDWLVLLAMAITLTLLAAVVAWYYLFSLNLRVEVSSIPDGGIRLSCVNRGIRPAPVMLPEDISGTIRPISASAGSDRILTAKFRISTFPDAGRSPRSDCSRPLWTIQPGVDSTTWVLPPLLTPRPASAAYGLRY